MTRISSAPSRSEIAPVFRPVLEEFERNFTDRGDLGASFAAVGRDRTLLDIWGGTADVDEGRHWDQHTLQLIFSGTKGLVATCMLILIDRFEITLDSPVRRYWPEFAGQGKENVLIRHVMAHQAGLPSLATRVEDNAIANDRRMAESLASQRPLVAPGEDIAYHALTFGWLCGELVRRVDGRTIGQFFADEVAAPLSLEIWIGLPAEFENRVATLYRRRETSQRSTPSELAEPSCEPGWTSQDPPVLMGDPSIWNTRLFHASEIPAVNGIASARSLARLYACLANDGELEGVRLLSPATVREARQCLARGQDLSSGLRVAFGIGFELQTERRILGPPPCAFGHSGAGGSVHGAWPRLGVGFSYAMNQMRSDIDTPQGDKRSQRLLRALFEALTRAAL
jgi:CubicO group peptidase (beta-lactamase class C family)